MSTRAKTALSLFSSGGIGDLALTANGYKIVVSNELLDDRHAVFQANNPETACISGSILDNSDRIFDATQKSLAGANLDLFYATPPCQGMSKNGRGKLLNAIRAGSKPENDHRNQLIIPTMELARRLRPKTILLENVPEMAKTLIVHPDGSLVNILEFVRDSLGEDYRLSARVIEFADYGVAQCRQRLLSVATREPELVDWYDRGGDFFPNATHDQHGANGLPKWITVRDAISHLPPLDAKDQPDLSDTVPFHRVPILDEMKYWWVSNTPAERTAFDNQCVECNSQNSKKHVAKRTNDGINRSSRETPIHCGDCGALLPRPSVVKGGKRVLMKGFTSAYKRMSYDKPASALTRNLSYACSDNKLHPVQNRVLSLHEAFILHSLDQFSYKWERSDRKPISDKTIREIIGESIPPAGLQVFVAAIDDLKFKNYSKFNGVQLRLLKSPESFAVHSS